MKVKCDTEISIAHGEESSVISSTQASTSQASRRRHRADAADSGAKKTFAVANYS